MNSNNSISGSSSSNVVSVWGQVLFASSVGSFMYLIWKNKKINQQQYDSNYYMIQDMNINPSPFYIRKNNNDHKIISTSPISIDSNSIRDLIKEKISSSSDKKIVLSSSLSSVDSSDYTSNDSINDKESLSGFSSPQSSQRSKRKSLSPRPTVHAPNPPSRNKEIMINNNNTTTTTTSIVTIAASTTDESMSSSSITDESISSSNANFYDIVSPIALSNESVSDIASPSSLNNDTINSITSQSTTFDTPQSGPPQSIMTPYQSQVKTLTTTDNISLWTSPIFADVREWEICTKTGSPVYVLECKTTKGPLLEWTCNKTIEQFYELKKELNSLLDSDIDLDGILSLSNNYNINDESSDTQLWHNCSILSKFMMTIILREDIMKKSSTFHLVTDFLDPDINN
jgi:hypothetical protein